MANIARYVRLATGYSISPADGERVIRNPTLPFYLSNCSGFSTLFNTYFLSSLVLVPVNITNFLENKHEVFSKGSSTSVIDFTNLIYRSFNTHLAK
jgi:hypothetical protein